MNILILSSLVESTGNTTTAEKIATYLGSKHSITLRNIHTSNLAELQRVVAENKIEVGLGVHALLGGPFLQALRIPYVLIMAGTDIYQPVHPLHEKLKAKVIRDAAILVTYTDSHRETVMKQWPEKVPWVRAIPKSIDVSDRDPNFDLKEFLSLPKDAELLLLPSGIRRIKDPMFGIRAFAEYARVRSPALKLAVIGPILEEDTGREFLALLQSPEIRDHVIYRDALPRRQMVSAIAQASAVVNFSIGEGASNAILEALALKTPVLARENDGNRALIGQGLGGWIFNSPQGFISELDRMLGDPKERSRRSDAGWSHLNATQSPAAEAAAYASALKDSIGD